MEKNLGAFVIDHSRHESRPETVSVGLCKGMVRVTITFIERRIPTQADDSLMVGSLLMALTLLRGGLSEVFIEVSKDSEMTPIHALGWLANNMRFFQEDGEIDLLQIKHFW